MAARVEAGRRNNPYLRLYRLEASLKKANEMIKDLMAELEVEREWSDRICHVLGYTDDDLPSADEIVERIKDLEKREKRWYLREVT